MLQFFNRLERHDISQHPYDTYYRMRKLERVCQKEGLDGLLIINGMDGKDNYEHTKLMNWLFMGFSGIEVESNEYLPQQLSETVFLFTTKGVRIFTDQAGFKFLKTSLSQLPQVEIFVTTPKQEESQDECEVYKVSQFVRMMDGISKVGVLLSGGKLEKWPLIQSYGLLGTGFFSMRYAPVNLTERVAQLYKPHDRHSLKHLIYTIALRLQGHASGCLGLIGDLPLKKRQAIKSEQLVELFNDALEIEENRFVKRVGRAPNVTMSPLHFTMETYDLFTSVRFGRTYFLSKQIPYEHKVNIVMSDENFIEGYSYEKVENPQFNDECFLMATYIELVQGVQQVLQTITQDYRRMTDQTAVAILSAGIHQIYNKYGHKFNENQLLIQFSSYNSFGEECQINFKDAISFKLTPQFFVIRIELNTPRGSLVVADSFILQENCYYLLTANIPYLQIVNTNNNYNENIETLKKRLVMAELGVQLSEKFDKNRLFISTGQLSEQHIELPLYQCSMILHAKGLRVQTQELGWFIILFSDMNKIHFTQSLEHVWMIASMPAVVLGGLQSSSRVAIEFSGRAVEFIYMKILTMFEEQKVPFKYVKEPKEFTLSRIGRQILRKSQKQAIVGNEIIDPQFLLEYLEAKQLTILNSLKDLKLTSYLQLLQGVTQQDDRIGIILITGTYSSGKNKFAQNLQRFGEESNLATELLTFSLLEQSQLDEDGYVNKLKSILKDTKVYICVVPFYLQLDLIVKQFGQSDRMYIRSVITKVNMNNVYNGNNHQIIQGLMSYCLPGYCQIIVIDQFGNDSNEVDDLNATLRSICHSCGIYRLTNNVLQSSIAKEIYSNQAYNTPMETFLRVKMGSFTLKQQPTYNRIFIPNTLPINTTIRKQLRDLFKQELPKFDDEIEHIQALINQPQERDILYIKGYGRQENSIDKLQEFTANSNYVIDRQVKDVSILIKEVGNNKIRVPTYPSWDARSNLGFLVIGRQVNKQQSQQIIAQLTVQMGSLLKLKSIGDISVEQQTLIEFENRNVGLDEGEFYDGRYFRNLDGKILEHHPKWIELANVYLKQVNDVITEQNNRVLAEWNAYVLAFNI